MNAIQVVCDAVGIKPPRKLAPRGQWARTDTHERNGKGDGEVMIHDDGKGASAVNWQTGQRHSQRDTDPAGNIIPLRIDPAKDRERREEDAIVAATCERIVKSCRLDVHPYLAAKGFPDEPGLICEDPWKCLPDSKLGNSMAAVMPQEWPLLIVPGRNAGKVTTVQFITPSGEKKNILRGVMGGSYHRLATGAQTVVCEGIATAMTIRDALRLLNVSATVLSAFSATNVERVAAGISGSIIAADHDKPIQDLGGLGTGEFYARRSGCVWQMPFLPGDWNDMHQREGLRAVAMAWRGVMGR